ncbi:MAG: hypothetical protein CMF12_06900 [Idiomarina sp.]|uniref:hypothetical protein n=1 Tax=Idiomarina sp. TaxID=1874361 RepID=UPI000C534BDF|nr:hypothetical protein [Idiomarina sp.]MBT42238.1 hypothetical protein [Idiomarina sp.]
MKTQAKKQKARRKLVHPPSVALTQEMIDYAESINKDKAKAIAFLQAAGLVDSKGKTKQEYLA